MASILDHRHFRDTQENLTALHDEWMHSSTFTQNPSNTTNPEGHYEEPSSQGGTFLGTGPGGPVPPKQGQVYLPPSSSQFIGHAPSDIQAFVSGTLLGTRGGPQPPQHSGISNPMTSGSGGGNGGSGCSPDQCDKGGGHCGTGCACCNTNEEVDLCMKGQCGTNCTNCGGSNPDGKGGGGGGGKGGGGKGGGKGHKSKHHHHRSGGGGSKAQGAGGLGRVPNLGNVPYSTTPTSGTSPILLVLMLGGGGLLIYFIWHKLRKSKAEDKELDKKGE